MQNWEESKELKEKERERRERRETGRNKAINSGHLRLQRSLGRARTSLGPIQMGLVGCLKKGMDLSNTIQGGKVVFKNVFMRKNWKNSFQHFSIYNF